MLYFYDSTDTGREAEGHWGETWKILARLTARRGKCCGIWERRTLAMVSAVERGNLSVCHALD